MFNTLEPMFASGARHGGRVLASCVSFVTLHTLIDAAKAAMIGATKALGQEVAKRKVTVNAVAPGFIKTDMTKDIEAEKYLSLIPMKRVGEAEEVAHLVSFLASEKASYITGEVININGGLYS